MGWSEIFLQTLKDNDVRLVTYVPDNVLTPLIDGVTTDNYFMPVNATREDEAIGTVAGAWMGGMKGVVMMQTSGFALIANALASLIVPHTLTEESTLRFIVDSSIKQAVTTQSPVAFVLSPLLTGGNPVAHGKLRS